MIGKSIQCYCSEDISLIENYDVAVNDKENKWHIHHKLETELNLSGKELKEKNLYYDRPAKELIFIRQDEHISMHQTGNQYCIGHHHSEETKKKISEHSFWNQELTEEKKQLLKVRSENLSKSLKGRKCPIKGKKLSEETHKKMSDAAKKRYLDPEERRKTSESLKGRKLSEESKKKMSDSHKGKKLSEETRKKMSEAHKGPRPYRVGFKHSEETKRKISETKKRKLFLNKNEVFNTSTDQSAVPCG